jgi:hypothetical protein
LLRHFAHEPDFWNRLARRAWRHQLLPHHHRAFRLAARLYGTPVDPGYRGSRRAGDRLYIRRLLARDGWGRTTRPATRLAFYVRSHWLRMPPLMLAQHLVTKARRSH